MAYYFTYKCPSGTKPSNIPSSKNTVEVYYKMKDATDVAEYTMVYTGEDPITLATMRNDPDMKEVDEAKYTTDKNDASRIKKIKSVLSV